MTDAETRIASFFARYEPAIAGLGKATRERMRERLPGLNEIVYVYEGQGSLVLSYSPSEGGADGLCAIALHPDRVKLFFGQGARLSKADPARLLQGRGKTVRHVVLDAVTDLDRPEIEALIAAAVTLAKVRLDASAKGSVILRVDEQTRRAKQAARPKPTRKQAGARR